jgi:outer membrane protein assembly factor BamA
MSISPERGVTALAELEKVRGSGASLQQMRADLRGYLSIPWSRSPLGRHVLALRAAGGRNTGTFILQRELRVGGDATRFPVRGYTDPTLRGQSAAIASVEYRFPIHEIDRGPASWPLYFHRVHGDVFVDAGQAWRQRNFRGNTIVSMGAEAAMDVSFGYVLPIRFRAGVAMRLRDPAKGDV